jgi:hypothetical protein
MPKSLVGKVKNKKFAFFWLLIGGGMGDILFVLYSLDVWPMLLPSAILSVLIAVTAANKTLRPKIWLWVDLLLAAVPVVYYVLFPSMPWAIFLPNALIIFGCVLGIMDW